MTTVSEPIRRGRGHGTSGIAAHEINWARPEERELIAFVDTQVRDHDQRHYAWVRRARVQLAWAAGDQLMVWDDNSKSLVDSLDVQADRISLFVNRIKPAILNWISLITARPISFRVHPATTEDKDLAAAHVSDKLARHYWAKLLGDDAFIDSLWMMFCTGVCFLKSVWDPTLGESFRIGARDVLSDRELSFTPDNGTGLRQRFTSLIARLVGAESSEVELDEDDQFAAWDGDLACVMHSGFDVIPPYRATSIRESPWIIIRNYQHIEAVRERYGKKAASLDPGVHEPFYSYQDYEASASQDQNMYGMRSSFTGSDHVLVYEIWRPRSRRVPKGFLGVVSQSQLLKKGANPYDHGQIPLVRMRELPSPKKFWPPSTVQDLMSLQAEVNITRSQVAEHKAATIEPRILAERGVGLDELAFTQRNEIVEVNPGRLEDVKPWVPEPLPSYIPYIETSLRSDFDDVARNHAPSYGKAKGSIKSGKHAVALQEADRRLNAPMTRLLRESLSRVCRQWLSILHQFVDEERTTLITGENGAPEVLKWSGQSIPYAEHNVVCDLGPSVDRQTTLELIDMLTARGWLVPTAPSDRETVYRWLGEGVAEQTDESRQDRVNASLEKDEMLRGALPAVSEGDEDNVHLYEHLRAMRSAAYRKAVASQPQIEILFGTHVRNHEQQRIRKQLRQRVMAEQIDRDLRIRAGLGPPPEANPPSGGQARPPSGPARPSGGPSGAGPQGPQPQSRIRKQRPVRASRRVASDGFTERPSGILIPK